MEDQLNELNDNFELINENEIEQLLENIKNFDIIYPSIGENMTFLKKIVC